MGSGILSMTHTGSASYPPNPRWARGGPTRQPPGTPLVRAGARLPAHRAAHPPEPSAPTPKRIDPLVANFSWSSATPESQGMCGSVSASVQDPVRSGNSISAQAQHQHETCLIVIRNDKVRSTIAGGTSAYAVFRLRSAGRTHPGARDEQLRRPPHRSGSELAGVQRRRALGHHHP